MVAVIRRPGATAPALAPASTFIRAAASDVLRLGSGGAPVIVLQRALAAAGFDPGSVDGNFSATTRAAVIAFQRSRSLKDDGVVGPATWRALDQGDSFDPVPAGSVGAESTEAEKLDYAVRRARELGLRITSTISGTHAAGSYHGLARAVDVAGPASLMAQFYREMVPLSPTELFYDPIGGIKNGKEIRAIGGHGNHVHVAF